MLLQPAAPIAYFMLQNLYVSGVFLLCPQLVLSVKLVLFLFTADLKGIHPQMQTHSRRTLCQSHTPLPFSLFLTITSAVCNLLRLFFLCIFILIAQCKSIFNSYPGFEALPVCCPHFQCIISSIVFHYLISISMCLSISFVYISSHMCNVNVGFASSCRLDW